MKPTSLEQIARRFQCRVADVKRQLGRNARQLREMEAKARKTGRKLNGYTADELAKHAADFEERAL